MSTSTYIPTDRREFRTSPYEHAISVPVATAIGRSRYGNGLLLCFTVTIFVSATLLFLVQPMVGKMILPMLGGTPAVWNACMLFFQAMLLAGYAYAHVTTSWLGIKRQAAVHLIVILLPLLFLPIVMRASAPTATDANPVFWLLGCLLYSVGLPFFVVSSTGPLLQKWFAHSGHASSADPYFLYAASNAGSMLALLGYPIFLEPGLALARQSRVWAIGYGVLIVMIAVCAGLVWRCRGTEPRSPDSTACGQDQLATREDTETVTFRRRMGWVLAALIPSSLMLGVTAHITSNLAPVPLLWVLPLAIYLLTFVLVFARHRPIPHALMVRLLPMLLPPVVVLTLLDMPSVGWLGILAHLITFFVAAMVCHGQLADSRPSAKHLTEFYLWMSIGGVGGGIFNAIIAPAMFSTIAEYPLAMVLSCLLLPQGTWKAASRRLDWIWPMALGGLAAVLILVVRAGGWSDSPGLRGIVFVPLALLAFSFKDRPIRFALGLGVFILALNGYVGLHRGRDLYVGRNFFGVKRVSLDRDGVFHVLVHGNTTHGKQSIAPSRSPEPLTYYYRTGPLGDIFSTFSGTGAKSRIAAVGLGAGSIAAYIGPGQSLSFYEIDPEVERIARNPNYFTFLSQCRGQVNVVLGDGRLTLAAAPDHHFGLIILDAFSSDAIPTHLLTREAIQLYLGKLEEDGLLVFHISNRYLDLEPLLSNLAADAGLVGLTRADLKITPEEKSQGKSPSIYVAMARQQEHFAGLNRNNNWKPLSSGTTTRVWTDQYTSILPYLCWRR